MLFWIQMSVIDDLRQFFLPDPSPKRMEKKEPPPRRPPRRPSYRPYKRPGAITKFAIETAHLPASVATQIELDFKAALAFRYTGRAFYRAAYVTAGVPPEDIPEEELEELPGAEGIRIPILGWELPSKQVRNIAQDWWESVVTWSDISLALEKDFVWTPLLADWKIEDLRVARQYTDPTTGETRKGIFIFDAAGNLLKTPEAMEDDYPLCAAILDWVRNGEVRPYRRAVTLPILKDTWLKKVKGYLSKDEEDRDGVSITYASVLARIEDALDVKKHDKIARSKLVNNLWRDFAGWAQEGHTFGIPEQYLDVLKLVEYRGIQFEVRDFFETWEKKRFFRNYIWVGFLRFESERRLAVYLLKNPKIYASLHKILSPLVSPDLAEWLLIRGRVLPNRLVGAFLRRLTTERFPKELLVHLRGKLSPHLFQEIGKKSLAELATVSGFPEEVVKQLRKGLYIEWKSWFLPGRFVEWAGRNLTKIQQKAIDWMEEQIELKTWVGRQLDSKIARLAGRRVFVDRALGKKPAVVKAFAKGAAVRKTAARVALSLWRKGYKVLARGIVKIVQGVSTAVSGVMGGPLGSIITAVVTTTITFIGGKIVGWVWEKGKPVAKGVVLGGCGCLSLLMAAPFALLVFIIAPAFQGGEMGGWSGDIQGWPGVGAQFAEISKTANGAQTLRLDLGADPSVLFTISYTNIGPSKLTSVTVEDDYAGGHDGDIVTILDPSGGSNVGGKLVWNFPDLDPGAGSSISYPTMIGDMNTAQIIINNVILTATTKEGEEIRVSARAVVVVVGGD